MCVCVFVISPREILVSGFHFNCGIVLNRIFFYCRRAVRHESETAYYICCTIDRATDRTIGREREVIVNIHLKYYFSIN